MDLMPSASSVTRQASDSELISALQREQVKALDVLYERYGKLVYSVALRILNRVEEAEDLTQEVFLELWQRSEIYQPQRGSLSGFLLLLTRSRALDRLRSRKSCSLRLQRWQTSLVNDGPNSPLESATLEERSHLVRAALKQLSPAERQVLETAYYDGLSQSQIAQQTDIPLGTVKSRSRQALKKLRTALRHVL